MARASADSQRCLSRLRAPARANAPVTLRMWAMGREGEVVQELVRDFEREHPGCASQVQQIPWSAAHEKLLTADVGGSTPDVAQLGNTWIPEFAALHALEPLDAYVAHSRALAESSYFRGIWDTNVVEGQLYGVPWYVDTRVLFYRTDVLARAGYDSMPGSWAGWRAAMEAVVPRAGAGPLRALPAHQRVHAVDRVRAAGGLADAGPTTARAARSRSRSSARAIDFELDLFHRGLAPAVQGAQIANRYQEFERGTVQHVHQRPVGRG